jgi:serine/threonine-protein kinase
MGKRRALLVGVQTPLDAGVAARPGTCAAVRRLASLLARDEGWELASLLDDEPAEDRRPLLANLLGRLKWLAEAPEGGLLLLSGPAIGEWFLPRDARLDLRDRTGLRAAELAAHLPAGAGVILDTALSGAFERASWLLADAGAGAGRPSRFLEAVLHAFEAADGGLTPDALRDALRAELGAGVRAAGGGAGALWRAGTAAETCPNCGRTIAAPDAAFCPACGGSLRAAELLDGGRYRLLKPLGAGGMGQVYLADDTRLRTPRAIKLLAVPPTLPEEERAQLRARLIQEARAAQALGERTHHVVRVFDVGFSPERSEPFLVMELLEGRTLAQRLAAGPMAPGEAVALAATIAETLAVAHAEGMVHRDLKPDNVMLVRRGDDAEFVKILDFGLVKMTEADVRTQSGRMMGTLQYMPPEQLRGRPVDARADVFSLGAVLYECLTGARANPGRTAGEIFSALLDGGIRSLRVAAPHLPAALADLVDRCLAADADRRPADGGAMARELRALGTLEGPAPAMTSLPTAPTVDSEPVAPVSLIRGEMSMPPGPRPRPWGAWVAGGLALVALIAVVALWSALHPAPSVLAAAVSPTDPPAHAAGRAGGSALAAADPPANAASEGRAPQAGGTQPAGEGRTSGSAVPAADRPAHAAGEGRAPEDDARHPAGEGRASGPAGDAAHPAVPAPAGDAAHLADPAHAETAQSTPDRHARRFPLPGLGVLEAQGDAAKFASVNCGSARAGDRVVTVRWSTRGYGDGRCDGGGCGPALARALREGQSVGEAVHVQLTVERDAAARVDVRCVVAPR